MIKLIHFKSTQATSLLNWLVLRPIACPAPSSIEQPDTTGLISVTNGCWAVWRHGHYQWKEGSWGGGIVHSGGI